MCSIFGLLDLQQPTADLRSQALAQSQKLRHRGPDWSGIYQGKNSILVHERLSIVDIDSGAQPLYSNDKQQVLAVNGEIYNHRKIRQGHSNYPFTTASDCEVILALYQQYDIGLVSHLSGMYAFILLDEAQDRYLIARDPIGIIPLYMGTDKWGQRHVASEMKALVDYCEQVETFPPGHIYDSASGELTPFAHHPWRSFEKIDSQIDKNKGLTTELSSQLRRQLTNSVKRHLMTDVPYGVLLSGGLDSSIIAALTKQFVDKRIETDQQSPAWWPSLHTFAIGLAGSPDLVAAQKVADHIGSIHHSFEYTIEQGIDALSEVIFHLETYDVTTIRASTPMYLMARKIRAMGIKMVLSGEGSDELFGGYLYFHKAPSAKDFHEETVRKIEKLHYYDCLRANKSMAAWGVEARVPFLDKDFVNYAMSLPPHEKMCGQGKIEKHLLREAFSDLLPHEIVWRQKEQFSDGVGYGWIDQLKQQAEQKVSTKQMQQASKRFPINTPLTKEAYWYREMFCQHFSSDSAAKTVLGDKSIACSSEAALHWDKSFSEAADPSGRAVLDIHVNASFKH